MEYLKKIAILIFVLYSVHAIAADTDENETKPILSIEQLVFASDMVVKGEIDYIITESEFFGYNSDGSLKVPDVDDSVPYPGLSTIDYSIRVDSVIYDPKNLYTGKNLTFRIIGSTEAESFPIANQNLKGESIFFLDLAPDNKTFGVGTYKNMIHIDGDTPLYHNHLKPKEFELLEDGFLKTVTSEEFESKTFEYVDLLTRQ